MFYKKTKKYQLWVRIHIIRIVKLFFWVATHSLKSGNFQVLENLRETKEKCLFIKLREVLRFKNPKEKKIIELELDLVNPVS